MTTTTITLRKNESIVAAWYIWAETLMHRFHGWHLTRDWADAHPTNLCYLFRRVFIYTPLILLMQLATILAPVYALVIYPMHRIGTHSGWWLPLAWIGGGVVVILLVIAGLTELKDYIDGRAAEKWKQRREPNMYQGKPRKPLAFFQLVSFCFDYLAAQKAKICPLITVVDEEAAARVAAKRIADADWRNADWRNYEQ